MEIVGYIDKQDDLSRDFRDLTDLGWLMRHVYEFPGEPQDWPSGETPKKVSIKVEVVP